MIEVWCLLLCPPVLLVQGFIDVDLFFVNNERNDKHAVSDARRQTRTKEHYKSGQPKIRKVIMAPDMQIKTCLGCLHSTSCKQMIIF